MTAIKDSHLENQSFWQHDYGHYSPNAALTQNLNADVAIIGGGIAGLTTALDAAQSGKSVWVLEQNPHFGGRTPTDHADGQGQPAQGEQQETHLIPPVRAGLHSGRDGRSWSQPAGRPEG